ncbi:hypothetical protein [Bacillus sp. Cr_A10]|uniref:hypothetical protein n=1 Tax=Bacillus sp. Cr_A10 TaxID=3033993 RepID=UPI0023DBEF28|nr:hypothetical protein [Bacillus sp. Cr_A10]MDF2065611.1 hypothetical protein [Bacillus sp. Cr_A10]
MRHICIIGGTGMLAEVTKWYAENDCIVSVVARNEEKLNRMKFSCSKPDNIKEILVDYCDSNTLQKLLKNNIHKYGQYTELVIWLHEDGLASLETIYRLLDDQSSIWHIIGSQRDAQQFRTQYQPSTKIGYHLIQLGFQRENNRKRWLTNNEIANGVIQSIQSGRSYNLIGELST